VHYIIIPIRRCQNLQQIPILNMQLLFVLAVLPLFASALPVKEDIPCGTQAAGYEPIDVDGVWKVVGGEHAKPHSWPWAAALMQGGAVVNCGGTLIDKRWLISAGHCFHGQSQPSGYHVKLGADDHGSTPEQNEPTQQVVKIEKFWVHPNFSHGGAPNDYDITLVKLESDVTLNEFVRPACLPKDTDRLQGGDKVVTIGWGQTDEGHEAELLQQVVLEVVDSETCKADWESQGGKIDETMVCAGNQTFGGVGSCFGDSGGALMAHRDNTWVLDGIVSWGPRQCGQPKHPIVYGYVPVLIDWALKIIQSEGYRL